LVECISAQCAAGLERPRVQFGLYADPQTLPEAHELPALLDREICALARPRRRTRRADHLRVVKEPAVAG
jgi:hypothetical protein